VTLLLGNTGASALSSASQQAALVSARAGALAVAPDALSISDVVGSGSGSGGANASVGLVISAPSGRR
jgi:hypothetical protein